MINSRSLNNEASRIRKVNVEVLALDQVPLISRPDFIATFITIRN